MCGIGNSRMKLTNEIQLPKFNCKEYECDKLTISSVAEGILLQSNGSGIRSGSEQIYLQIGNQFNCSRVTVCLQWIEPEDEFRRVWVIVKEGIEVDKDFKLPKGATVRR